MIATPLRTLLRRQLITLRNEVAWARAGLEEGHQPPHGLDMQVASAFLSIGQAGLAEGERCQEYAEQLQASPGKPWGLYDADRIIDRINAALGELSGPEQKGV